MSEESQAYRVAPGMRKGFCVVILNLMEQEIVGFFKA